MARVKILVATGIIALSFGLLLLAWVNDSADPPFAAEHPGLILVGIGFLVGVGILTVVAGCLFFLREGGSEEGTPRRRYPLGRHAHRDSRIELAGAF
jgi:hypothetical protein